MIIQKFINDRNKFKVEYKYQRLDNAWSKEDKQCMIDSILRNEFLPFKNYKEAEYNHTKRSSDDGKSKIENIMILCKKCHDRIQSTPKLKYLLMKISLKIEE